MYDISALGLNLQVACADVVVMTAARSTAAEVQGWGRVALKCGQPHEARIYRKVIENSHDLWKEKRLVEKSLLEVARRATNINLAELMVSLLNDEASTPMYDLDDLDEEDILEHGARLVHAKFMGSTVGSASDSDIHIEYDALSSSARQEIITKMTFSVSERSKLKATAVKEVTQKGGKRKSEAENGNSKRARKF